MNGSHSAPPPRRRISPKLAAALLALCALPQLVSGQAAQNPPSTPSSQLQPVSLPHLYWHFLIHQNDLDNLAAQLTTQGSDGLALRNDMQTRLGFSDADYAPIRTSAQRLATELQPIESQLKSMQGSGWNGSQAQALIAQRETYIGNEIYNLSIELSAPNKAALESFMTAFFALKNVSVTFPPAAGSSAGKEVQP